MSRASNLSDTVSSSSPGKETRTVPKNFDITANDSLHYSSRDLTALEGLIDALEKEWNRKIDSNTESLKTKAIILASHVAAAKKNADSGNKKTTTEALHTKSEKIFKLINPAEYSAAAAASSDGKEKNNNGALAMLNEGSNSPVQREKTDADDHRGSGLESGTVSADAAKHQQEQQQHQAQQLQEQQSQEQQLQEQQLQEQQLQEQQRQAQEHQQQDSKQHGDNNNILATTTGTSHPAAPHGSPVTPTSDGADDHENSAEQQANAIYSTSRFPAFRLSETGEFTAVRVTTLNQLFNNPQTSAEKKKQIIEFARKNNLSMMEIVNPTISLDEIEKAIAENYGTMKKAQRVIFGTTGPELESLRTLVAKKKTQAGTTLSYVEIKEATESVKKQKGAQVTRTDLLTDPEDNNFNHYGSGVSQVYVALGRILVAEMNKQTDVLIHASAKTSMTAFAPAS